MEQISRIGMDTSKHIFQLHGVHAAEEPVLRRKLRRKDMVAFFAGMAPVEIAIEACGASHHWARLLQSFGHEVKLIAPQLVKPFVKCGKNDAADAEAPCEAMSRPTMRFVPVKTAEQQAGLMLMGVRDRLIRSRCNVTNAIRSFAAEFGLTAPTGDYHLPSLFDRIATDCDLPVLARELFAIQMAEYEHLRAQIAEVNDKLQATPLSAGTLALNGPPGGAYDAPVWRRFAPCFSCPIPRICPSKQRGNRPEVLARKANHRLGPNARSKASGLRGLNGPTNCRWRVTIARRILDAV